MNFKPVLEVEGFTVSSNGLEINLRSTKVSNIRSIHSAVGPVSTTVNTLSSSFDGSSLFFIPIDS